MLKQEVIKLNKMSDFYRVLFPKGNAVFFDIETTGLSPASSRIYLIGALAMEADTPVMHQWFSEDLSDEKQMLTEFIEYCSAYDTLITYNGETFDIPFITSCVKQFHLDNCLRNFSHFTEMESFDIYKKIKGLKKILPTQRMNLKTMECFIGIKRTDPFDGVQLIEIYDEYLGTHDERLYKTLLLHNYEDVTNLPDILTLLTYEYNLSHPITDMCSSEHDGYISFSGKTCTEVPAPVSFAFNDYSVSLTKDTITVNISVNEGMAKLYYPDYKNYFYFPYEDKAIHISVAVFTEKSVRKPATPETSYSKFETSLLLSEPSHILDTGLLTFLIKHGENINK